MPKARKRRVLIRWAPVLWLLLVINVAAGLLFSPITAIRRVRVAGAPTWDETRIEAILAPLQGIPCAQVKPFKVESAVLADAAVARVQLDRNLFGSAVLTTRYREPVARLADRPNVVLAGDGTLYASDHVPSGLPGLRIDPSHLAPELTLASDWASTAVARLAAEAPGLANGRNMTIELAKDGSLCLNMGAGQVDFGSCDDMEGKLATLRRILSKNPAYLTRVKSLNLAVASVPAEVPIPDREQK